MLFAYANQIQHHMTTIEAKRFTLFIDVHAFSYIMMIGAGNITNEQLHSQGQ